MQGEIGSIGQTFDVPEANGVVQLIGSAVEALEVLGGAVASGNDGGQAALQVITALNAAQLQLENVAV
ncbi:MAG TPA: hypothetical protein VJL81_07785 [Solirubrobacterales bacterium]|nr:hypothetical protein [Solirubrobacterales bacterium]